MEPESGAFELRSSGRFRDLVFVGVVVGFMLLEYYFQTVGAAAYLVALVGLLGGAIVLLSGRRGTVAVSERQLLIAARWRRQKRIPLPPRHVRLLVETHPHLDRCTSGRVFLLTLLIEDAAGKRIRFQATALRRLYEEAGRGCPSELHGYTHTYWPADHTVSALALNAIGTAVGYGEIIPGAESLTEKQVWDEALVAWVRTTLGEVP